MRKIIAGFRFVERMVKMDDMTDVKKAERFARSLSWATLFGSIGLLLVITLPYFNGQAKEDISLGMAPLVLTMLAGSLEGLAINIRRKFVFLAFQLLFLVFAVRSLMHSANS